MTHRWQMRNPAPFVPFAAPGNQSAGSEQEMSADYKKIIIKGTPCAERELGAY